MSDRYTVYVKPQAKQEAVLANEDGSLTVLTKKPPRDGAANEAVIASIAAYFKVPKSSVRIVLGKTSREKLVEITR